MRGWNVDFMSFWIISTNFIDNKSKQSKLLWQIIFFIYYYLSNEKRKDLRSKLRNLPISKSKLTL